MAYKIYKRGAAPQWWIDFGTHNGKRIRQSTGTEDKAQALAFAKHRQTELWRAEKLGEQPSVTWDYAVVDWVKANAEKKDLENDKHRLRVLSKYFRAWSVTSISGRDIRNAVESLGGIANSTRNRYLAAGSIILNYAANQGWRPDRVSVQRFPEKNHRIRYLNPVEASRLLSELPDYLRAMAEFSLATGLRESNVRLLEWSNVDLPRSIAWVHGDQAKAGKSLAVPLNGRPLYQCNNTAWKSALKRVGIDNFRWHDLRHTWASWHVQNDTSLYDLKVLGGWASMAMVERYAHMTHERVARVSGNIDGLIPAQIRHTALTETPAENTQLTDYIGRSWQARTADQRIKRAAATRPGNQVFPRNIIDLKTKNLGRKIPKQEKNSENVPREEKKMTQIPSQWIKRKRHRK